jgi:hypothetical protein
MDEPQGLPPVRWGDIGGGPSEAISVAQAAALAARLENPLPAPVAVQSLLLPPPPSGPTAHRSVPLAVKTRSLMPMSGSHGPSHLVSPSTECAAMTLDPFHDSLGG